MRKNILQHIGAIVSGKRNEEHLTQQQLAQQTGRGLRHIQNIEKGRVNASVEVLAGSTGLAYQQMFCFTRICQR